MKLIHVLMLFLVVIGGLHFALSGFCKQLEEAVIATVEAGQMTKDLAILVGKDQKFLTTGEFIDAVASRLSKAQAKAA